MFRNFFKTAWRNLWKNKTLTLINLTGLSVSLGFLFLAAGYIWREWRVNTVIPDNERVLVLRSKWQEPGMGLEFTVLAPLAGALHENYPHLVAHYYHHDGISSIVSVGNRRFSESLQPGDATFLDLFGFPVLHGRAELALEAPFSLVLTAAKALKYFGKTDVVGETLRIQSFSGEEQAFQVTAVLRDLPYNTVTNYNGGSSEIFLSASSLDFFGRAESFESWQNPYLIGYVKLRENVSPERLTEPIRELLRANTPSNIHDKLEVYTVALKDSYLQMDDGSALRMMYTLGFVALFILTMAVVNFINTSVSNALTRLREAGLRKVLGGNRQQITLQYLVESVLFGMIAALAGLLLYVLIQPVFSDILGKPLPMLSEFPLYVGVFPLLAALVIGLLAGFYPALILSGQPSVFALQGKLKTVSEKKFLQRVLLALQLTTAIVVFIGATVVHRQVTFFFRANLGYDKESLIHLRTPRDWTASGVEKMQTATREFARLPEIAGATLSFEIPDGQSGSVSNRLYRAAQDSSSALTTTSLVTDENYLETYGMAMAAGEFFDRGGSPLNQTAMILNETAARGMGWSDPSLAIGEKVRLEGNTTTFTVRGVIRDFHFNTMHERIRPLFFTHVTNTQLFRYLSFRLKPGNLPATIEALHKKWSSLFPDAPFDYQFMDEALANRYQNELQLKKASQLASVIALIIVLLGVIGIVLLAITRRTKEVGVRTVLGASFQQIVWLFSREFFWTMLLANVVAWPVAWWLLRAWLDHYAYQVTIRAGAFAGAGLTLGLLTILLVAWLVHRKGRVSPAESLRAE